MIRNSYLLICGFNILVLPLGSIEGYKDPELKKSKGNWREMMKRNMRRCIILDV